MVEKKWLLILGIVNVLAVAGIVFWYVNRDHTPPVIAQEEEIVYEETLSDSELLQGVVAMDETEGNVSHTLVVEKITVNHNTGIAMVTCGAMDSSGNIAKQSFRMAMAKSESPIGDSESDRTEEVFTLEAGEAAIGNEQEAVDETEEVTETEMPGENVEEAEDIADAEDTETEAGLPADEASEENDDVTESIAGGNEVSADVTEEQGDEPNNEPANQPAAQANSLQENTESEEPVLNFSASEVKTRKGQNPAWVTVIGQLQDNKDTYEYLLQNLRINGEFTNSAVGSYDVTVFAVDSDGNESMAKSIRITVEE